jgi:hypothetical protein
LGRKSDGGPATCRCPSRPSPPTQCCFVAHGFPYPLNIPLFLLDSAVSHRFFAVKVPRQEGSALHRCLAGPIFQVFRIGVNTTMLELMTAKPSSMLHCPKVTSTLPQSPFIPRIF